MTNHQENCPVCNTGCSKETKTCESCGFTDRLGIAPSWIDYKDAEAWMGEVVMPYRRYWELKNAYQELSDACRESNVANKSLSDKLEQLASRTNTNISKIEELVSQSILKVLEIEEFISQSDVKIKKIEGLMSQWDETLVRTVKKQELIQNRMSKEQEHLREWVERIQSVSDSLLPIIADFMAETDAKLSGQSQK